MGGDVDGGSRFFWPQREAVDVEHMVREAFARSDDIHADISDRESEEPVLEGQFQTC
jgi:hypothetical protein